MVVTRIMEMKEEELQGLNDRRAGLASPLPAKEEKTGFFSRFKAKKKGK